MNTTPSIEYRPQDLIDSLESGYSWGLTVGTAVFALFLVVFLIKWTLD